MPGRSRILIFCSETTMLEGFKSRFAEWGYHDVVCTSSRDTALHLLKKNGPFDLVFSDALMPESSGLDLVRHIRSGATEEISSGTSRKVLIVIVAALVNADIERQPIFQPDASDPTIVSFPHLKTILEASDMEIELFKRSLRLESKLARGAGLGELIGTSKSMREIYNAITQISCSDAPVIITGERGTGKKLAAHTIHLLSRRSNGPFVIFNGAATAESQLEGDIFGFACSGPPGTVAARAGCFERAKDGDLLLVEIAEMPVSFQTKLVPIVEFGQLRRLGGNQDIALNARLLATTNEDPRSAVERGRLSEDLFYRLNVFTIEMPPLRTRASDISLLAAHFIREFIRKHNTCVESGVKNEVLELLQSYSWPGNVRELSNVIEESRHCGKRQTDRAFAPAAIHAGFECQTCQDFSSGRCHCL